jgi:DNA-binding MarR family transcriptional regulator
VNDVVTGSSVRAAHELRAVVGRLRRRLREVAAGDDLTPSQSAVLGRLGADGPASASALAAAEGVRPQSMATTLAALGQLGLVRRDPDPQDGRRQLLTLTPAGRERMEGGRQAKQEWLARAFQERYTQAERQLVLEAMALLGRLT